MATPEIEPTTTEAEGVEGNDSAEQAGSPANQEESTTAAPTPNKDAHFDRLDDAIERYNCKGSMLVVGIDRSGEDEQESDDDEEEEEEQAGTTR